MSWKIIDAEVLKEMVVIICVLYLLLPVVILVVGSWRMFVKTSDTVSDHLGLREAKSGKARRRIKRKKRDRPASLSPKVLSWYAAAPLRRWIIESSVLFGVAAAGIVFSCDSERKALFEVDYYAYNKMWPEVIQCAQHCPNNYFMVHAVNRALYHTSRLGYEMFSYHQNPDTLFLTTQELLEAYWKRVDIYLDLGCINLAEHELTESLGTNTQRPAILKRLALASMVKGDIDTADTIEDQGETDTSRKEKSFGERFKQLAQPGFGWLLLLLFLYAVGADTATYSEAEYEEKISGEFLSMLYTSLQIGILAGILVFSFLRRLIGIKAIFIISLLGWSLVELSCLVIANWAGGGIY